MADKRFGKAPAIGRVGDDVPGARGPLGKVGLFQTWGRASTQTRLDELFARPHTLRTGVDRAHQ
jgi:hypothetical protein